MVELLGKVEFVAAERKYKKFKTQKEPTNAGENYIAIRGWFMSSQI